MKKANHLIVSNVIFISTVFLLTACKGSVEPVKEAKNVTEPAITEETAKQEWNVEEEGKHFTFMRKEIKKNQYAYRCIVKNDRDKVIYDENFASSPNTPSITEEGDIVDVHYGYGNAAFMDKYIDWKNNRQSEWFNTVWGVGKKYIAYINGDWEDGSNTKIIIDNKFGQTEEKEYVFPHVMYNVDVDKCEFRNSDKELYLHYKDKDTKKEAEVTIALAEFEKKK